jgi:tetratricopeptide (TPR) repeat protein
MGASLVGRYDRELLRGRHQAAKATPEGYTRAREYFEQAIALDPQYGEPHSLLGACFLWMGFYSLRPGREVMPVARAAAARALELSPSDPWAHAVLSVVAAVCDYHWREAERQSRLALGADPIPLLARCVAAWYLFALGRFEEALREFEAALEQDPLNLIARRYVASGLRNVRSCD